MQQRLLRVYSGIDILSMILNKLKSRMWQPMMSYNFCLVRLKSQLFSNSVDISISNKNILFDTTKRTSIYVSELVREITKEEFAHHYRDLWR